MRTQVEQVTRSEMRRLISTHKEIKLSELEQRAFKNFLNLSPTIWVGKVDDELLCIFGIMLPTLADGRPYLWLHTTDAVKDHEFVFVRQSQIAVKKMLERYPVIHGHCEVSAAASQRWLRWLGAVFGPPEGLLIPFQIVRKDG